AQAQRDRRRWLQMGRRGGDPLRAGFVIDLGLPHPVSVPGPAEPGAEARVAVDLRAAVQLRYLVEPEQGWLAEVLVDQPPHLAACFVAARERRCLRSQRLEVQP